VPALQIGIGVTALLALLPIDAPTVFLGGFLLGASFHAADHVVDRHLGGHSEDVIETLRQANRRDGRSQQ
jgi:hypothetical protein